MTPNQLRIGIVGTGQTVGIAHYHVLGVLADPRAAVSAVYDLNPQGAAQFLSAHGLPDARVCQSYVELLERVDGVVICTPNAAHIPYVLGAIQAGKALLVEKPLALTPAESLQAVEALRERPVFNMVGFVYRYANIMQALRDVVRSEIGPVYSYTAAFGGRRLADPRLPLEWRMQRQAAGSGALGDFGSHLVDNAHFVAGLRFTRAAGLASTVIPTRPPDAHGRTAVENDDLAVFVAGTDEGALASFTVSRVGMDHLSVTVTGPGGLARISLGQAHELYFWPAPGGVYAKEPLILPVAPQTPFDDWFAGQVRAFIDGLSGIDAPVADIPHGHYVESVLAAALDTAETAAQAAAPAVAADVAANPASNAAADTAANTAAAAAAGAAPTIPLEAA